MITITEHIKINALTIFMFALCSVFHYPVIFYITYAVMLLHEAAHMTAAICIGLKVDYIAFQPFGVNLRLKNTLVPSIAEEIILYISGPLVNAFSALLAAFLYRRFGYEEIRLFYISNLALFAVNMLPALPLDGGVIARRVLTHIFGFKISLKICAVLSVLISGILIFAGVYAVINNPRNFSVLLFALLLLGNLFTSREKYSADFAMEQALARIAEGM